MVQEEIEGDREECQRAEAACSVLEEEEEGLGQKQGRTTHAVYSPQSPAGV